MAFASRSLELLPRKIALKFNFWCLKSHRAVVVLNTALPPPPARKGGLLPYVGYAGVCRWKGYGFWSLSLDMVYNVTRVFPNRVWSVRSTFHSFFCPKQGQGVNPQHHPYTQTLVKSPPSFPPPAPGAGGHGSGATAECAMMYLWPKLWNTVTPQQMQ